MFQSHAHKIHNQKEAEFDRYTSMQGGEDAHPLEIATDRLARALLRVEEAIAMRIAEARQEEGQIDQAFRQANGLREENENLVVVLEGLTEKYQQLQQVAAEAVEKLDHSVTCINEVLGPTSK
jgi:hypothetical protein